ncbi:hypothetical protein Plhal304r1_c033g0105321 [Plasmopara halstedii]
MTWTIYLFASEKLDVVIYPDNLHQAFQNMQKYMSTREAPVFTFANHDKRFMWTAMQVSMPSVVH